MKCPIDQTEMEKGNLANHGTVWSTSWLIKPLFGKNVVGAYKCPKCGKVELKVEEKS